MRALLVLVVVTATASAAPWRVVTVDAPDTTRDARTAERFARAYLAAHRDELAPGDSTFELATNSADAGIRTVAFRQLWHGMPVVGAQLGFVFAHDHLIAIATRAVPRVRATGRGEVIVGDRAAHVVDAWPERIYVDDTGRELARESQIVFANGTLEFNAGVRYASGPRANQPASASHVTIGGSAGVTGLDGAFSWSGTQPTTIVPGLDGSFVMIRNAAGANASTSLPVQPGQAVAWDVSTDELVDAQLSTYIYANLAKARARTVNPALGAWLDQPMTFFVNETGFCNAFSDGNVVHLYRGTAGQCENSGRVADVVFHEFGHAAHYHSILTGMGAFELALSEGLADYYAANMLEDSALGRGLHFDNQPTRDIDPFGIERVWPTDESSDAHVTGLIISGALWDLRKALVATLGHDAGVAQAERIFTGVMQRAADIPGSYVAALIADDDDGDLMNGTPHHCAITRAFGVHGLAGTDYQPVEITTPVTDGRSITVPVITHAEVACPAPQLTSVTVTWNIGDAVASSFSLAAAADGWQGAFPPLADGSVLSYAVDFTFDDGEQRTLPDNPADPLYQYFIGASVPLFCARMDTDPQWEQSGNGTDWQVTRPLADPPAPHTGIYVLGTDISDGSYRPNELTSIVTPQIDVSAYPLVHLQFWRWLTIEAGQSDQAMIDVNGNTAWHNHPSIDHIDKEWRFVDVDMSGAIGDDGLVAARWTLRSDAGGQLGGWRIDDVCFVGVAGDVGSAGSDDKLTAGGGGCNAGGGASLLVAICAAFARAGGRRDRSRTGCRNRPADRARRRRPRA